MRKTMIYYMQIALMTCLCFICASVAADPGIAIMQDQTGVAQKYRPLIEYLGEKGIESSLVAAKEYPATAAFFAGGGVDAMFSGSGIASTMIIKELAAREMRPVDRQGHSTYWAVIITPKGSA